MSVLLILLSLLSALVLGVSSSPLPAAAAAAGGGGGVPIQHRIAHRSHGMSVSWSTIGPIDGTPVVAFGSSPNSLTSYGKGFTNHYDASITWFHHVELDGLKPSTKHYWQVVTADNITSPILSFTTAPKVGDNKPLKICINGDMGIDNSDDSVALMKKIAPEMDLFWHVGDLSYADDWQDTPYTYEEITEAWMNNMTDVWKETPYMVLPGNHETSCSESNQSLCTKGQLNFSSYRERFNMPNRQSGSPTSMFYSFDFGLVHFISLDTEVDYPGSPEGPGTFLNSGPFGDQKNWLREDLKRANENRDKVPFIFVAGHHPFYSSYCNERKDCDGVIPASRPFFEPLFLEFNVDVAWYGHIHWYERLWPIGANFNVTQKNYDNPTDPVYFVSASPGNIEGLSKGKINESITAFLDQDHYGIGILDVLNSTTLHWSFVESATGKLLDEVTITKESRKAVKSESESETETETKTKKKTATIIEDHVEEVAELSQPPKRISTARA